MQEKVACLPDHHTLLVGNGNVRATGVVTGADDADLVSLQPGAGQNIIVYRDVPEVVQWFCRRQGGF
jgi:hypothetical protein